MPWWVAGLVTGIGLTVVGEISLRTFIIGSALILSVAAATMKRT